jgi:hypothetical protein
MDVPAAKGDDKAEARGSGSGAAVLRRYELPDHGPGGGERSAGQDTVAAACWRQHLLRRHWLQ